MPVRAELARYGRCPSGGIDQPARIDAAGAPEIDPPQPVFPNGLAERRRTRIDAGRARRRDQVGLEHAAVQPLGRSVGLREKVTAA